MSSNVRTRAMNIAASSSDLICCSHEEFSRLFKYWFIVGFFNSHARRCGWFKFARRCLWSYFRVISVDYFAWHEYFQSDKIWIEYWNNNLHFHNLSQRHDLLPHWSMKSTKMFIQVNLISFSMPNELFLTRGRVSMIYIVFECGLVFKIHWRSCSSSWQRALKPDNGWEHRVIDA